MKFSFQFLSEAEAFSFIQPAIYLIHVETWNSSMHLILSIIFIELTINELCKATVHCYNFSLLLFILCVVIYNSCFCFRFCTTAVWCLKTIGQLMASILAVKFLQKQSFSRDQNKLMSDLFFLKVQLMLLTWEFMQLYSISIFKKAGGRGLKQKCQT